MCIRQLCMIGYDAWITSCAVHDAWFWNEGKGCSWACRAVNLSFHPLWPAPSLVCFPGQGAAVFLIAGVDTKRARAAVKPGRAVFFVSK